MSTFDELAEDAAICERLYDKAAAEAEAAQENADWRFDLWQKSLAALNKAVQALVLEKLSQQGTTTKESNT